MKKPWILALIVLVVLAGGYLGRHKIKSMLGMTPAPTPTTTVMTPTPSMSATDAVMTKTDPAKGTYLADTKGMTLYIYDKDTKGVSNCTGVCATTWPPYVASSAAVTQTNVTTLTRVDGKIQYAYSGLPLYYNASDAKPGDITGDGVGGVWHIVKPQ